MTPRAYVNATLIGSNVTENTMSMGSSCSSNHLLSIRDLGDYNVEITAQFGTIILFFQCLLVNVSLYLFSLIAFLFRIILRLQPSLQTK